MNNPGMGKGKLKKYIQLGHVVLREVRSGMKLKASIVVIVTDYLKARYIVAGNSRFNLVRDGAVHIKSIDMSLTANLVEQSLVPLDKAALHEERNNLYCYLGQEGRVMPYISKKIKLKDGDIFVLLSRGAWEYCDEGEMIDCITDAKEPQEVIDQAEELILSKQPKDIDNYTFAVTFVDKIYRKPNKKWTAKKIILLVLPFVIIGLIIGVTLYICYKTKKDNTQAIDK